MTCCITFLLAIAYLTLGAAKPLDNQHHLVSTASKPQIMDEAVVSSNILHILSKSVKKRESGPKEQNSPYKPHIEAPQNNKNDTLPPTSDDSDNFLLSEKFPDLPNDEYLDIEEDSTPFDFLKQNDMPSQDKISMQSLNPTNNASNAIYITVPIFINTANGGTPISLSVGGQTVPLNNSSPSPKVETESKFTSTSKFNKLAYRSHPIQRPMWPEPSLNRHRSFVQGKSRVRKHKNPIKNYDKYDTYILYY